MSENQPRPEPDKKLQDWIKKSMDEAVRDLMDLGVVESVVAEARPAWVLPFTLLIGQVREHGKAGGFDWFIWGDGPTTVASSTVAASPREAARHFALQWHLQGARKEGAEAELTRKAEALYELVEDPQFWSSEELT